MCVTMITYDRTTTYERRRDMIMIDMRDPLHVDDFDDTVLLSHVRDISNAVLVTVHMTDDDDFASYALVRAADLVDADTLCDDCDDTFAPNDPVLYYADPATSLIVHAHHLMHD